MNYGEKLLAQHEARILDSGLSERQRAAQADNVRLTNERALTAFLCGVFQSYVQAIEDNVPPSAVRMPREIDALSGKYAEIGPDSPKHPFHDLFKPYAEDIAKQHGLKFVFSQAHDGGGMEGWINVAMVPVKRGEAIFGPVGIETLMVPHEIRPTRGFICVKPDGSLVWPSFKPTREESVRLGVGAGIRGEPSDKFMEDKAREGWRCVPVVLTNAGDDVNATA
jgi:hypothetical protein